MILYTIGEEMLSSKALHCWDLKKGDLERVTFRNEQLRKYFPRSYTTQQMQDTIIKLLDQWQKKKARDQER